MNYCTDPNNLTNNVACINGEWHYMTNKETNMLDNCINGTSSGIKRLTEEDENYNINRAIKEIIGDNFIFLYFNNILNNVSNTYQFRLIYLTTFCCFRSASNKENYINIKGDRIKKTDLKYIFTDIEKRDYLRMIKYFFDNKIILEDVRGDIFISSKYCKRGAIVQKYDKNNRRVDRVIRSFDTFIRELYNSVPKKEHKRLNYLIQILPYIHIEKNILVGKDEVDKPLNECHRMTYRSLSDDLGIKATRLKDNISNLKVNGEFVIGEFKVGSGELKKEMIVVNPKLFLKSINPQSIYEANNYFTNSEEIN